MSDNNPYRMYRDLEVRDEWSGDPVEQNAPGLDGRTLNGLLQRAYAEGHRKARAEAARQAQDEKITAWGEGHKAGYGDARQELRRELRQRLTTLAEHLEIFEQRPKTTIAADRNAIAGFAKRARSASDKFLTETAPV